MKDFKTSEKFSTKCDKKSLTVSELRVILAGLDGRAIIGVQVQGHIQYASVVDVIEDPACSAMVLELRGQIK